MAKKQKTTKTKTPQEVALNKKHAAFLQAEQDFNDFVAQPKVQPVLMQVRALVTDRNERLDDVVRTLKKELTLTDSKRMTVGAFGAITKSTTVVDTDLLRRKLPRELCAEFMTKTTTYTVDEEKLAQLVRQGDIPAALVKRATTTKQSNPANIPGTPKLWDLPPIG